MVWLGRRGAAPSKLLIPDSRDGNFRRTTFRLTNYLQSSIIPIMETVSTPLAAAILGVDPSTVKGMNLPSTGGVHRFYRLDVLEQALGKPITAEMLAAAEAKHASRKAQWQRQNNLRRAGNDKSAGIPREVSGEGQSPVNRRSPRLPGVELRSRLTAEPSPGADLYHA